jgi:hypothetical protein
MRQPSVEELVELAMRAVLDPGQFTEGYGSDRKSIADWQREALRNAFSEALGEQMVIEENAGSRLSTCYPADGAERLIPIRERFEDECG